MNETGRGHPIIGVPFLIIYRLRKIQFSVPDIHRYGLTR